MQAAALSNNSQCVAVRGKIVQKSRQNIEILILNICTSVPRFSVRQPRKPVMHNVNCLLVCQPVNRDELIDNQNKLVQNYEFYLHKTVYCIIKRYLSKKFRVISEKLIKNTDSYFLIVLKNPKFLTFASFSLFIGSIFKQSLSRTFLL